MDSRPESAGENKENQPIETPDVQSPAPENHEIENSDEKSKDVGKGQEEEVLDGKEGSVSESATAASPENAQAPEPQDGSQDEEEQMKPTPRDEASKSSMPVEIREKKVRSSSSSTSVGSPEKKPGPEQPPAYPFFVEHRSSEAEENSSSEEETHQRSDARDDYSFDTKELNFPDGSAGTGMGSDHTEGSTSIDSLEKQEERERMREKLIEQYRQAVIEHKIARETNLQLQTKLAEYFRRKKADAAEQQSGTSSLAGSTADTAVDYEQRYNKYIASLTELRHQYQTMQTSYHKQIEELKEICAQRQKEVDEAYKDFTNYKYNIGKKALHSRTGRPINPKELVAMLAAEQKKEAIVMEVRLENIKLRNEVAKVEAILKSKEELAEGLHLIDFEQLKIENQTYNEKIEERNEELTKLKRKIACTVQIMTHVKEKLQAVQFDNAKQRQRLGIADAELTFNRDQLTRLKQARDRLRAENSKLRRSCGLLGKSALLLNYEDSVDAVNGKKAALEETRRITAQYQSRTKSLIEKIEAVQEKTNNA
ncbi:unnamed protein product [Calicophoron daubneyi]|uniref:CCDC113/CCDC96 coiled-coil domain-containing protein n=1 Tax=Calicophoron daubneyi TaxID=300641 RepID=A0AAV2TI43_CALDB